MKTIQLDAGHGDVTPEGVYDPGAVGKNGTTEAEITLAVTLKLGKLLSEKFRVIYSREKDRAYDIWPIIDDVYYYQNADMLISIHCNSCNDRNVRGVETFYNAESINGQKFASIIQNQMMLVFPDSINRGIKNSSLRITNIDNVNPVILVELEFINNPQIEKLLKSEDVQNKIAKSLYDGVCKYYSISHGEIKLDSVDASKQKDNERQIIKNIIRKLSTQYKMNYCERLSHAIIESNLDPNAVSSSNALGVGQVKLTTAQDIAKRLKISPPEKNEELLGLKNAEVNLKYMFEYVKICNNKVKELCEKKPEYFIDFLTYMLYFSGEFSFDVKKVNNDACKYSNKIMNKIEEIKKYC